MLLGLKQACVWSNRMPLGLSSMLCDVISEATEFKVSQAHASRPPSSDICPRKFHPNTVKVLARADQTEDGAVRGFRQKFTLDDAIIGSHACSLEARACI
jgi:hypothetical protein